jgi:TPR repeat protein
MNRLLILPFLLLTLLVGNPAASADFQKGYAAYQSGDYATALREWEPLAEQGLANVQYNLGVMYDKGQGVPQNYKIAVKWYRLAAEQGTAFSQGNLGVMYALGKGVMQDNVYAQMWGNIGASNGNENGGKLRDLVAKEMTPADISAAQKLARECIRKKYEGC